jgi:hypothetical protein
VSQFEQKESRFTPACFSSAWLRHGRRLFIRRAFTSFP